MQARDARSQRLGDCERRGCCPSLTSAWPSAGVPGTTGAWKCQARSRQPRLRHQERSTRWQPVHPQWLRPTRGAVVKVQWYASAWVARLRQASWYEKGASGACAERLLFIEVESTRQRWSRWPDASRASGNAKSCRCSTGCGTQRHCWRCKGGVCGVCWWSTGTGLSEGRRRRHEYAGLVAQS